MVDLKSKLQLHYQAKALDGEIFTFEKREPNLQSEVESDVQDLNEVELSWVEYRELLTSIEKRAADTTVAVIVIAIISASVSLEQAPANVPSLESATTLPEPTITQPQVPLVGGSELLMDAQSEETP